MPARSRSHAHRRRFLVSAWCPAMVALTCSSAAEADNARTPPQSLRVFYTGHSFHRFVAPCVEQLVIAAGVQGRKLSGTQGINAAQIAVLQKPPWDTVSAYPYADMAIPQVRR